MIEDLELMISRALRRVRGRSRARRHRGDQGLDPARTPGPRPVDIGLTGGERIHLGGDWHVEVLHTPGHSLGSISIWDPRSRSLAIGDAVLWNAVLLADGEPAFPPTYRYLETYLATIERMQAMPVEACSRATTRSTRASAVAGFLGESRAYTDRVDHALRSSLAESATSHAGRPDASTGTGPRGLARACEPVSLLSAAGPPRAPRA